MLNGELTGSCNGERHGPKPLNNGPHNKKNGGAALAHRMPFRRVPKRASGIDFTTNQLSVSLLFA